jgi:hypothetical protein
MKRMTHFGVDDSAIVMLRKTPWVYRGGGYLYDARQSQAGSWWHHDKSERSIRWRGG